MLLDNPWGNSGVNLPGHREDEQFKKKVMQLPGFRGYDWLGLTYPKDFGAQLLHIFLLSPHKVWTLQVPSA